MIYIKKEYGIDLEVNLAVYEDEFYSICPCCGKEVNLDKGMLIHVLQEGDMTGTSFYCEECSRKKLNENINSDVESNFSNSFRENSKAICKLIEQVKNKELRDSLFIALDTLSDMIGDDLSTKVETHK